MILLTFLFIAFSCIFFMTLVVAELSKRNTKSGIRNTSDSYLEYRQMLFDKMDNKVISNEVKPKSKLRGVKKRYQKV